MRKEISSARNPVVQRFRDAAVGKVEGVVLAEGVRLVGEVLAAGCEIVEAAVSPRLTDDSLRSRLEAATHGVYDCSDSVLGRLSQLETPQGVAVLVKKPEWSDEDLLRGDLAPLVVVVAGARDPGNLGSVVRTAEAAGASGLLTMRGGADPFRDKAVRGSMGSVFRLPIRHGSDETEVLEFTRRHRLRVVVADGGGDVSHTQVDLRKPMALIVGAEAAGVPAALLRMAEARVRIPLRGPVESLNVAVAAGVLLFEAQRQRS